MSNFKYIVGRDKTKSNLVISDGSISSTHACISCENGRFFIEDLNSTNGTMVNGVKINSKTSIMPNDTITVSNYRLIVSANGVQIQKLGGATPNTRSSNTVQKSNTSKNQSKEKLDAYPVKGEIIIGREKGCGIVIENANVSRKHARVFLQGSTVYVEDLKSVNGVSVNGKRIKQPTRLNDNDSIIIVNTRIIFKGNCLYLKRLFKASAKSGPREIAIRINNLSKSFDLKGLFNNKTKTVLHNISANIYVGEFTVILGTSGAGKSVLMSCVNGSEVVPQNAVIYSNDEYNGIDSIRQCIGAYVPQDDIIYKDLTVERCLYHSLKLKNNKLNLSEREINEILYRVISMVNLMPHKDTVVRKLSGGQRKRVSIAQEFLGDPDLIFLDEPTSGLDPGTEYSLMETFKKMTQNDGRTVVLVTHDIANIDLCDKVIILGSGGHLCYSGSYNGIMDFFKVDRVGKVYSMIEDEPNAIKWASRFNSYRRKA